MTKLTRTTVQWNSGVMLGWNSSKRMNGIMRHPSNNSKQASQQQDDTDFFPGIKVTTDNNELISSFFPSVGNAGGAKSRASTRPRTRRYMFEPQKDFSPEFLEYLRSLTKRDFEHATEVDIQQNNKFLQTSTIDSVNNNVDKVKVKATSGSNKKSGRNVNLVDGHQLFSSALPPLTNSNSRPSTVPRYFSRKEGGKGAEQNNRSILRPSGITPPAPTIATPSLETDGTKVRPLTKTKVTPSQIDNASSQQNQEEYSKSGEQSVESASYSSSFTGTPNDSERPSRPSSSTSSTGSKRVTFAADVVNYERENKPPKKRKLPKRRRQGFPHPSRGIFVPPELEIVESTGPTGICKDNPYLNFNQVWTHPAARSTGESSASRVVRQERFHRIMNDLEHAHVHYNRLVSVQQNDYLIQSIFKRYVLVLDLALTEGHLTQVEHLLETVSKSIPVLQQNTFYYLYGPKIIKDMEQNNNQDKNEYEHPDLVLIRYALSRISVPTSRQDAANMSIETVLVKLCLELIELVFSQYGSFEFRNALTAVPSTVRQAITLLKELRTSKDAFIYVKWINNSAVQRDYRSILKSLGLLDRYGCKAIISPTTSSASVKPEGVSPKSKSKARRASGHAVTRRVKTPPTPIPEMMQPKPILRPNSS